MRIKRTEERSRLTLDMPLKVRALAEGQMKRLEADSLAEVLRRDIKIVEHILTLIDEGFVIVAMKDETRRQLEFFFPKKETATSPGEVT